MDIKKILMETVPPEERHLIEYTKGTSFGPPGALTQGGPIDIIRLQYRRKGPEDGNYHAVLIHVDGDDLRIVVLSQCTRISLGDPDLFEKAQSVVREYKLLAVESPLNGEL